MYAAEKRSPDPEALSDSEQTHPKDTVSALLLSGVNFMFAFACIYSSLDALDGENRCFFPGGGYSFN